MHHAARLQVLALRQAGAPWRRRRRHAHATPRHVRLSAARLTPRCPPPLLRGLCRRCFKEETFGPLVPLFRFKDEDEVLQLANTTGG